MYWTQAIFIAYQAGPIQAQLLASNTISMLENMDSNLHILIMDSHAAQANFKSLQQWLIQILMLFLQFLVVKW